MDEEEMVRMERMEGGSKKKRGWRRDGKRYL